MKCFDWLGSHPEEVEKHRGKRVGVHPERGIVAVGANFAEVAKQLDAGGYGREVAIISIPPKGVRLKPYGFGSMRRR